MACIKGIRVWAKIPQKMTQKWSKNVFFLHISVSFEHYCPFFSVKYCSQENYGASGLNKDRECILKKSDKGELTPIFICFAKSHEYTDPIVSKEISWNPFIATKSKVFHFNQCITTLQSLKYFEFGKRSKIRTFYNSYQWELFEVKILKISDRSNGIQRYRESNRISN